MATFSRCSSYSVAAALALALAGCSTPPRAGADRPDLNGTWGHQRVFGLESVCVEELPGGSRRNVPCPEPPGGAEPSLDDTGFPAYKPELAMKVAGLRDRQVELDTVLRCFPPGVPRIGPPAKIVQTDREVVFLYEDPNGSFFRIVPLDAQPGTSGASAKYLGDAVGRFEGDTLVVETVNFTDETWLTDNGAFHTTGLRVVERLRRVGDTIEYQATAHDPAVLAEPWALRPRVLRRSRQQLEEPPRCEERDLANMVDPSQFHENPR